jgi:flagellar basal body-associated protein FliL
MMTGAMHGAGWIFMIFFWTLIVLGIAALGKWLFSSDNGAEQQGRNPERPYPFPRSARLKGRTTTNRGGRHGSLHT